MNSFVKYFYGMFIVMVMLSIGAGPVAAMPEGSYKKSCRNCSDDGNALSCECSYNKRYSRTTLDYTNCQPGSIWNEKSKLMCSPAESFPEGSYKKSCANCSIEVKKEKILNTTEDIQELACQCKMKNGNYKDTNIATSHCKKGSVRNDDGNLKCDRMSLNEMVAHQRSTTKTSSDAVKKVMEAVKKQQAGGAYFWVLVKTDDCAGNDIKETPGSPVPSMEMCNKDTVGKTAVCWDNVTQRHSSGRVFCTYKQTQTNACTGGQNIGYTFSCRYMGN